MDFDALPDPPDLVRKLKPGESNGAEHYEDVVPDEELIS